MAKTTTIRDTDNSKIEKEQQKQLIMTLSQLFSQNCNTSQVLNLVEDFCGWTLFIHQHRFGHPAQKKTYLHIVGIEPAELPNYKISLDCIVSTVGHSRKSKRKRRISVAEREHTPPELIDFLIQICKQITKTDQHGN